MAWSSSRAGRALGAAAVAVALVGSVAACSSSKSSSTKSSGGSSGSATSGAASSSAAGGGALGTPKKATGSPIKLGFISAGVGGGIDNSTEAPAAKAAVAYANDYLGGIGGHVIQLDTCVYNNTPAGATNCGNQMVSDKVSLVMYGTLPQAPQVLSAVDPAKIPVMGWETVDADMVGGGKTGTHFVVTNLIGEILGAPAKLAQEKGIKKSALVVVDVPAAVSGAQQLGTPFFKAAGVGLDIVKIAGGTADMTPQIQSAISGGAKSFGLIGNVAFCTSALKAIRTLGFKGLVSSQNTCLGDGEQTAKAIPGGLAGVELITPRTSNPSAKEVQLYNAVLSKYAPSLKSVDTTGGAYAVVLTAIRALDGAVPSTLDAAGVLAAIKSAPPAQLPLSEDGVTFQCNGKAVSIAPGVCASGLLEGAYDAKGDIAKFTPFDPGDVMKISR